MRTYFYLILCLLLSLYSCEDIIDPDGLLDNNESLVIINSFIAPQSDVIAVKVSRTEFIIGQPINDFSVDNKFAITNAIVSITDEDGASVDLPYSENNFRYQIMASDFSIVEGKRYFLKVIVNEKEFNASCRIPDKRIQSISELLSDKEDDDKGSVKVVKVRFDDITETQNFYIVGAKIENTDPNIFISRNSFDFESDRFATDNLGDGTTISSEGILRKNDFLSGNILKLQVANVEQILYQSLLASYLNSQSEGSPVEEVIIPPNNILETGGYGVFAGFQLTEKEITF
ncbi:DUF4249 domain-containing protein [Aquimarina sp. RZ0]|uniref:DUF4249 domain-containing protein n=1 Tax=Aquimarina sp. RZ0 TaxID=2607730 RepID=UPI0011F3EA13|nr:DUF4249 domain-containing protein [Aquimarina sp. RZ0]KAA1247532.1 DUF4249 family protein [Aquimarina sp. RZ0]